MSAAYYAKGMEIWKSPVSTDNGDGTTSISIGFQCATATEIVGEEGAQAIAEMLTLSDSYLTSVVEERDAALAEVAKFREASKAAYLGLQVLKTMCRKKGLTGGVEATESAMRGLVDAMPELPALSALRGPVVVAEAKP